MGERVTAAAGADQLLDRVASRRWGLALFAMRQDSIEFRFDTGADELGEGSVFDIGSIAKTVTALLLADCVVRGTLSLDTTVGDILGDQAGAAASISLADLATHRSGLPRLPPNLDLDLVDPADPYAAYDAAALLTSLKDVVLGDGSFQYSNYGFMLLGHLLSETTKQPYGSLAHERVFEPLGLENAGCPAAGKLVPGYNGSNPVPWWHAPLPGAGGVGMSIRDLAGYAAAHVDPPATGTLGSAITLVTTLHTDDANAMGLGWVHQGGGWWHNGGTSGFHSFVALHAPTRTAVGLLANSGDLSSLDHAGFAVLTEMARS